jgi:hypothetical protein
MLIGILAHYLITIRMGYHIDQSIAGLRALLLLLPDLVQV